MRDVEASFAQIKNLRPSHRLVSMWSDLRAVLNNIHQIEFYLGYLPEKPNTVGYDHESIRVQLDDARRAIGMLALAIAEEADS
ncbi:hypothetical protein FGL91_14880 [Microbacterium sp. CBA3102]|nr:hypothetical protein FGL91_14880 [Microbacterium sp. CBA3102]